MENDNVYNSVTSEYQRWIVLHATLMQMLSEIYFASQCIVITLSFLFVVGK